MPVYHIHINGRLQGVGFRPFVHKLAVHMEIDGWISNGSDGFHIICSCKEENIYRFYEQILENPPTPAIITEHTIRLTDVSVGKGFFIKPGNTGNQMQMPITPDIAICDDCKREIRDPDNRRYQYPFTTCINCGPRYSITTALPYDRLHSTMHNLYQCLHCIQEYNDIKDARYHSQTNSCPDCAIALHLYESAGKEILIHKDNYLQKIKTILQQGGIVAVKDIGGYVLLCDATNESSIVLLRNRKKSSSKPFALLYADLEMLYADTDIRPIEVAALKDKSAPIVLCRLKKHPENNICVPHIAPGLNTIGAMLPSSPLLQLIADRFGKPLIATSANLSGSPIIYKDEEARNRLSDIAEYILTYDRNIVAPQEDSVLQFTSRGQKIILRRGRGLAPTYYPLSFAAMPNHTLAMGTDLKSAFAVSHNDYLFISQFLGDQQSAESQKNYDASLHHVSTILGFKANHIITDNHPHCHVSERGREISAAAHSSFTQVQRHKAHFAAVMAENHLLEQKEPVLGIIWDGGGYGNDEKVWGGEIFIYDQGEIRRTAHLANFPQLSGENMNREPRLSAMSLLSNYPASQRLLQKHFTDKEWVHYLQLLQQPQTVMTSSMGRLIDGVACLLGIAPVTSYDDEASVQLEALAQKCTYHSYDYYNLPLVDGIIEW